MPVRSLRSAVHKWPDDQVVLASLATWAEKVFEKHSAIVRIGYLGSYARGDWGYGSDLDVVMVYRGISCPKLQVGAADIPVPVDLLVYSEKQLNNLMSGATRFGNVLRTECEWL